MSLQLRTLPVLVAFLLAAALLRPLEARAAPNEASLDHAGSIGLLLAVGPELSYSVFSSCPACGSEQIRTAVSGLLDVGATFAPGLEGDELVLRLRLVRLSGVVGEAVMVGYRGYFGREAFKTFFEVDLQASLRPLLAGGIRSSLGAMYELSPLLGLWGDAGINLGLGAGYRVGFEATFGIQARSYLLE